ncbi:MAG: TonB-dependent receptor [Saprospiraceae bacterium]|nr:TonB-dependent receptor [Saprospiraceae bacterium]
MKTRILQLFILMLLGLGVQAQVTNSSLTGTVKDKSGAIIGATVQAVHLPTNTLYGTITNENGIYTIMNMRSGGPYKIEISYVGYSTINEEGLFIPLGSEYVYNVNMNEGVEIETIEIVGTKSNILNSNRTGATSNFGVEQINNLPTISRSISDFTRLSPQAQAGSGFAGRDGRYNNIQIDGANFNNNFGLSSNNLPGGASQPISLDAIEEIQVNVAPYDVRQTNFTGAGINAITRSGTNEFKGSAYMFYRNEDFNGTKVGSETLPLGDKISYNQYGARIGGPIIKNKLFFFVNGEYENSVRPGISIIPSAPGRTGTNVSRTTIADMERVKNFVLEKYNYDPGALENYANEFATKGFKVLGRLDWNINNDHKFSIKYNSVTSTDDQVVNGTSGPNPRFVSNRVSLNSYAFENANYNFTNTVNSIAAELNSKIGKISNQLLVTFTKINDKRGSNSEEFPFIDILSGGDSYMSLGYELFSFKNEVRNNVFTLTNNLSFTKGKHNFTGGFSFDYLTFGNSFRRYGTSYYKFASIDDFLNERQPTAFARTYSVLPGGKDPFAELNFGLAGVYFQDQYRVNDKFKLTAGVRFDMPLYLNELIANPAVNALNFVENDGTTPQKLDLSQWSTSKILISPRIGFNYDLTGDRKFQIRGGTGIFTGRAPFVWFTNLPTNSGMIQNTVELTTKAQLDAATVTKFNPAVDAYDTKIYAEPGKAAPGSIAALDRNLQLPSIWRTNLAADINLPSNTVLTLEGIYSKDLNALYQYNANQKGPIGTMNAANGADKRPLYGNTNALRRVNVGMSEAMVLTNTNEGYSYALTASLSKEFGKSFSGFVAYTRTVAKDLSGNPGSQAASAWSNNAAVNGQNRLDLSNSQFAVPDRVVGAVTYKLNLFNLIGTTVSLFYEGSNQGRFSYRYTADFNQDGINADLIYIPKDPSEITFTNVMSGTNVLFTAQQQSDAFFKYIEQDDYLKENKGTFAERDGALLPWRNRFDLKFLFDVNPTIGGKKRQIQFSADILNFGNMLSPDWGLRQFTTYNNGAILVPKC